MCRNGHITNSLKADKIQLAGFAPLHIIANQILPFN
ncbi:hypothetical protein DFP77_11288 [Marinomonas foliarum]|uniref:Uncharacterized protein n=1 Tax=Marinomonas foliarum TaxID=491950 RepID=A0A369A2K2_9GAMM|nr:hypothetical protein DFP77_11288 [Marinomonas foliarum]